MNRVAIVTGGASGIGLAITERLVGDGWYVAVVDADSMALSDAEDLMAGEDAIFLSADVTDEEELAEAFDQAVETFGLLSALVNCAAIRPEHSFEETTAELFRQVLDINMIGPANAAQAALARMGDGLAIVNLIPTSGLRANDRHAAYGAAGAGVKMLTEVMAIELASRDVRANCVATGLVDTASETTVDDLDRRRVWLERTPQHRDGDLREVAGAVAYLLSADAGFVTGHTLVVDGGLSISGVVSDD